jgi:hypothetical protein
MGITLLFVIGSGERLSASLFGTCSVSRAPYKLTRRIFVCVTDFISSFESGRLFILFNSNLVFFCKGNFVTH